MTSSYQKFNLQQTSFIIHFRNDCSDRVFNLKTITSFLNNFVDYKELIIINDDKKIDSEMFQFKNKSNIIPLFLENNDEFKKSSSFNIAAAYATGKILCFYDVDVLIEPSNLEHAQNLILNEVYDHVYPFNGCFVNIDKPFFDKCLPIEDFEILKNELTDNSLGFNTGNIHVCSDNSPGGCNLISKKAFNKIGGYDEHYIGWGFEDTDFRERSNNKNRVNYLTGNKDVCWHLSHSTHNDQDRSKQPHYKNNLNKFLSIIKK